MSRCRICLENKIKLLSVFNTDYGITYASMITCISTVKIVNGSNEMICLPCSKKVKAFYDFKVMIERSDFKLNGFLNVYKFNTIDEINFSIKIEKNPLNYFSHIKYNDIIQNENDCVYYNNTLIKRVTKEIKAKLEICDAQKEDYVDFSHSDTSIHEEYVYKKKKKKKLKDNSKQMICIKPILVKDLRLLRTSIQTKSNKNDKEKTKKKREDICPYCGKKSKAIKSHILRHTAEKAYCCNECNKRYYSKQSLHTHIKTHLNEMKFKCNLCIDRFSSKTELDRHMTSHTDIKKFACNICKKEFKYKTGLQRHTLIHSILKKFQCEQCPMSFVTKYNLQHHSRVHTGERPYKCELCAQPYSYKRDFNRHCLKKHGVFVDRRPVNIMNEEVLKHEKALIKNIVLKMHGMKTDKEPLDYFQGPTGAQAFAKLVKLLESKKIPIDVDL